MNALIPVIPIVIAFTLGLWLTFGPLHVMYTLSALTIWLIEHFFHEQSTLLKHLQANRSLLEQDRSRFAYNLRMVRFCGIVVLIVGITWVWMFYG